MATGPHGVSVKNIYELENEFRGPQGKERPIVPLTGTKRLRRSRGYRSTRHYK